MSLGIGALDDILKTEGVEQVEVTEPYNVHGEPAILVVVRLFDGRLIEGTFTTNAKPGFGGVQFAQRKDIPKLMKSKVDSVLAGTADLN